MLVALPVVLSNEDRYVLFREDSRVTNEGSDVEGVNDLLGGREAGLEFSHVQVAYTLSKQKTTNWRTKAQLRK